MGVIDRLQETWYRATGNAELAEQLSAERQTATYLQETLADLEARMYEPGWQKMTAYADQEFSRQGLHRITAVCRIMALKNPLIKRGLALRQAYVWGQGVATTARDDKVNEVIQAFMDDPGNRRTVFGAQACEELERSLGTDGNVFIACFTSPKTGRVQVRVLPWDEIGDIITNPEDSSEPWFYRRESWTERTDQRSGGIIQERRLVYYPALGYRPAARPPMVWDVHGGGLVDVMWDAPVRHVKVNGLQGWKFGVPDAYAAIDWANAYREFLTDWATLIKALSRFAWRLTSKGTKQAAAKAKISAAPSADPYTGERRHAGATASLPPDMALEAVPKSGATIDSESGRPLAAMVAAAMDVPVTMLLGDPGTTGARATAETLDTPTEQAADLRRGVWTDARQAIFDYVIQESVRAPDGLLKGTITRDEFGRDVVDLAEDMDGTVDQDWPDLDDVDVQTLVTAIVAADGTGHVPPLVIVRLLLQALGVTDIDEILDAVTDDQGNFLPPEGAGGGAGQAAVNAFNRGEDPAALFNGPPDPPPPDDTGQQDQGGGNGDQRGNTPPRRGAPRRRRRGR